MLNVLADLASPKVRSIMSAAVLLLSGLPLATASNPAPATAIFFTDYGTQTIWRAAPNGTGATQILPGVDLRGLAVDARSGKVYYAELAGRISRANLDGSGAEATPGNADGDPSLPLNQGAP